MSGAALIAIKNLLLHVACLGNHERYFALKGRLVQAASRLGLYEREYLRLLPFFVTAGSVVVDVGANVGVYTHALASLVGPSGRVIAFEPVPPVAACLARSSTGLSQVTLIREALSDAPSAQVDITVPYIWGRVPEPALARLGAGPVDAKVWRTFHVPARRLDDHPGLLDGVCFIKADIEGHEAQFLTGATSTIAAFRPLLQVESGHTASGRSAVAAWARQSDYTLFTFAGGRFRIPREQESHSLNVYLVPSEATARLPPFLVVGVDSPSTTRHRPRGVS